MFHDIVPLFRLNLPLFKTKKAPKFRCFVIWLRGPDLNRRPSGYEPDELPSCSTPRPKYGVYYSDLNQKIKRFLLIFLKT